MLIFVAVGRMGVSFFVVIGGSGIQREALYRFTHSEMGIVGNRRDTSGTLPFDNRSRPDGSEPLGFEHGGASIVRLHFWDPWPFRLKS